MARTEGTISHWRGAHRGPRPWEPAEKHLEFWCRDLACNEQWLADLLAAPTWQPRSIAIARRNIREAKAAITATQARQEPEAA